MRGLSARIPRTATEYVPILAIVLAAATLTASYALKASNWAVMTDELQTSKLATSIAESFSLEPHIHGAYYGALSQLYPLVISPFFRFLTTPAAVEATHALNCLLLASTAWPAALLARRLTGSWPAAYVAAAITAFVPWLVLSATLLTENIAYPVFVWAVLLIHRALAKPSPRADAAALAGLVLAFFARTQLIVLAVGFPIALLAHELASTLDSAGPGERLLALRAGASRAVARHPLLVGAYAAGGAAAAGLAAEGHLGRALGNYSGTLRGDPFPAGIWRAAAMHLEYFVLGIGLVPFLLAFAWAIGLLIRPRDREAQSFALLLLVLAPLLTLQAASFNVRFTPGGFIEDRYLAYLAPLVAIGAVAAIVERGRRATKATLALGLALAFSFLTRVGSLPPPRQIFWASPAAAFQRAVAGTAASVHVSTTSFVRWGSLVVGLMVFAALWRAPLFPTLVAVGASSVALGITEVIYVFDQFAVPATTRPRTIPLLRRDWVDASLHGAPSVALVPNPNVGREFWWDAEFWNKRIDRVLRIDGSETYTPFPDDRFSADPETGAIRGLRTTRFFVVAGSENRIHLRDSAIVFSAPPLRLLSVRGRPFVDWSTSGAYLDGWSRPGRVLSVRLFPTERDGVRKADMTLRAPPAAAGYVRFELREGSLSRRGRVPAGGTYRLAFDVCVPRHEAREIKLSSTNGIPLADGRVAGLRIDSMNVRETGRPCPGRTGSAR